MKLTDLVEGYDGAEEYKGFKYDSELEREEDNQKIFHYLITPKGKRVSINYTPYKYVTMKDFKVIVDTYLKTGHVPSKNTFM